MEVEIFSNLDFTSAEFRKHGNMKTWRYGDIDMETWTNGDMDKWTHGHIDTWTHGEMDTWRHGHMEKMTQGDMDIWRHGHRGVDMETLTKRYAIKILEKFNLQKNQTEAQAFSLI
jgi:hypothetical protein